MSKVRPASEPSKRAARKAAVTWLDLEEGLAAAIDRMAVPTFLIISARGTGDKAGDFEGSEYYVQFGQGGVNGFRAEAVSNRYLAGMSRTSPAQERRLIDLGWLAPNPNPDSNSNVNWHREWPQPTPSREIAAMAVTALRDVFGVSSPTTLRYKCFDKEGRHFAVPQLPLDPEEPRPSETKQGTHSAPTMEQLRPIVDEAMKSFLGVANPEIDADGDTLVRFGSASVYVRVLDQPPRVRIFSPVLWNVAESPELLAAVNHINLQTLYGRAMWTGHEVVMAMDVPAAGITAEALSVACFAIGSAVDHFDDELYKRFGGKTVFKADG
jgi:Putative bacterial sensory transduction regulator